MVVYYIVWFIIYILINDNSNNIVNDISNYHLYLPLSILSWFETTYFWFVCENKICNLYRFIILIMRLKRSDIQRVITPYFWKWWVFAYFLCTVVLSTSEKIAYMYTFMFDTSHKCYSINAGCKWNVYLCLITIVSCLLIKCCKYFVFCSSTSAVFTAVLIMS